MTRDKSVHVTERSVISSIILLTYCSAIHLSAVQSKTNQLGRDVST